MKTVTPSIRVHAGMDTCSRGSPLAWSAMRWLVFHQLPCHRLPRTNASVCVPTQLETPNARSKRPTRGPMYSTGPTGGKKFLHLGSHVVDNPHHRRFINEPYYSRASTIRAVGFPRCRWCSRHHHPWASYRRHCWPSHRHRCYRSCCRCCCRYTPLWGLRSLEFQQQIRDNFTLAHDVTELASVGLASTQITFCSTPSFPIIQGRNSMSALMVLPKKIIVHMVDSPRGAGTRCEKKVGIHRFIPIGFRIISPRKRMKRSWGHTFKNSSTACTALTFSNSSGSFFFK